MGGNNPCESYTTLTIIREREETDDEYQKRIYEIEIQKKDWKMNVTKPTLN